jgi:hypothetical protein
MANTRFVLIWDFTGNAHKKSNNKRIESEKRKTVFVLEIVYLLGGGFIIS